jgi:ubiquinone/menaquinone biosynthesis C-methylase UbiE
MGEFIRPTIFDKLEEWLTYTFASPFYQRYVNRIELRGDERVLELGCLGGALSRRLAYALADGGSLLCVDIGKFWIDKARKRLRRFRNIDFKLGDVRTLDLAPASYDAAVVHFVLHDIDQHDRQETINTLARILVDGGRIYLREPTKESHGMSPAEIRELIAEAKLQEIRSQETRSRIAGPMFEAVYEKPFPSA